MTPKPAAPAHDVPPPPGEDDLADRVAELERELLQSNQTLQALQRQHETQQRRQAALSDRQWAEIERLRTRLAALHKADAPPGPASGGPGGLASHQRFAEVVTPAEVDDALGALSEPGRPQETPMEPRLFTRAVFQPVFTPNDAGRYEVETLLALHDRAFVRAAYLAILRRDPDAQGSETFLAQLRAGEPKARLLQGMLASEEGRRHGTVIRGLDARLLLLRVCDWPLVGRLVAAVLFLLQVNAHLRDLRVLENHVIRIAEESQAVNESNLSKLRSAGK
jgi:Domain of unknown function (DUF4214)